MAKSREDSIYLVVKEIQDSQEMNIQKVDETEAITTIKLLRQHVKTLMVEVYDAHMECREVQKVATMLQKVEDARSRFMENAVKEKLKHESHKDIMPYEARNEFIADITSSNRGKIDIHKE